MPGGMKNKKWGLYDMVPQEGVEPTRDLSPHWILSPARLPVPPLRHVAGLEIYESRSVKAIFDQLHASDPLKISPILRTNESIDENITGTTTSVRNVANMSPLMIAIPIGPQNAVFSDPS
jgi:hypothetical protein